MTLAAGNPQNIDDAVLRIERAYEVRGMLEETTSYDATSGGNAVDQVLREYNDWGLLAKEYQDHDSAVSIPASGPCVEYLYEDANNPTRLTVMVYPNGRELTYNYAAGNDAALDRVTSIVDDDATVLAEYTYLGFGNILAVAYPEPGVSYDMTHQDGNGQYDRLDQFGRVKSAYWTDGTNPLVHLNYGYDLAGNRTYREDVVAGSANLDELYAYDGMNQLTASRRGQLNATYDGFESLTENSAQNWTLDATGNWSEFKEGASQGNWTLDQDRTANAANELTSASSWATPDYDQAGNMTFAPQPNDLAAGYNLKYDAWNRMVRVTTGSGETEQTVAEYRYDGDNRRIVKTTFDSGDPSEIRHFYFSQHWQVLEERVEESPIPNPQSLIPASQYVWGQRYVDDLILRDRDTSTTPDGIFDERHYALQDANWDVVAIVGYDNSQWQVLERYTYTAYGKAEYRNTSFALQSSSAALWTVLYTGRELDIETGLQINRARYYHPDLGTFIVPDPIGYDAGDLGVTRNPRVLA